MALGVIILSAVAIGMAWLFVKGVKMAKKLSADSVLNPADLDGDGEITNSELDRYERMIRIETTTSSKTNSG